MYIDTCRVGIFMELGESIMANQRSRKHLSSHTKWAPGVCFYGPSYCVEENALFVFKHSTRKKARSSSISITYILFANGKVSRLRPVSITLSITIMLLLAFQLEEWTRQRGKRFMLTSMRPLNTLIVPR
jgi:hypothetical protein